MFNLFKKKQQKAEVEVVPIVPSVIAMRPVTSITTTSKPKTKKPKTKEPHKYNLVRFTGLLNKDICDCVLLDSKVTDNYTINIVLVFRKNGKKTTPYIKWINDSYCTIIPRNSISISHIDIDLLNIDNWDIIKGEFR